MITVFVFCSRFPPTACRSSLPFGLGFFTILCFKQFINFEERDNTFYLMIIDYWLSFITSAETWGHSQCDCDYMLLHASSLLLVAHNLENEKLATAKKLKHSRIVWWVKGFVSSIFCSWVSTHLLPMMYWDDYFLSCYLSHPWILLSSLSFLGHLFKTKTLKINKVIGITCGFWVLTE